VVGESYQQKKGMKNPAPGRMGGYFVWRRQQGGENTKRRCGGFNRNQENNKIIKQYQIVLRNTPFNLMPAIIRISL
jgi:hypothetical protein